MPAIATQPRKKSATVVFHCGSRMVDFGLARLRSTLAGAADDEIDPQVAPLGSVRI